MFPLRMGGNLRNIAHLRRVRPPGCEIVEVVFDIEGEGKRNAIVKEIQYKAISSQPLAIDFLGVKAGEKVTVVVPIEAKGDPEGLREGGQLADGPGRRSGSGRGGPLRRRAVRFRRWSGCRQASVR